MKYMHTKLPDFYSKLVASAKQLNPDTEIEITGLESYKSAKLASLRCGRIEEEIMEVVEDMGETCKLEVLVLIDTSASMYHKLSTVKEALIDLSISLQARIGDNVFSMYQFPGKRSDIEPIMKWSPNLDEMYQTFPKLASGGITPTGPALQEAMYQFGKNHVVRSLRRSGTQSEEEFL